MPTCRQPQVGADFIQGFIGGVQAGQALRPAPVIGRFQVLAQVEGGIQQAAGECMPLRHRKVVSNGQQPGKEIKRAGEDGGVIGQIDLRKL